MMPVSSQGQCIPSTAVRPARMRRPSKVFCLSESHKSSFKTAPNLWHHTSTTGCARNALDNGFLHVQYLCISYELFFSFPLQKAAESNLFIVNAACGLFSALDIFPALSLSSSSSF